MTAHEEKVNQSTVSRTRQDLRPGWVVAQAPERHRDRGDQEPRAERAGRRSPGDLQPSWLTPSASALLALCRAIQGYSEPVRQRTMQSTKPRKPSGIRYSERRRPEMGQPEQDPGHERRQPGPDVAPGHEDPAPPQRAEQEAAEEEFLGDRRDHADEHGRRHERRGAVGDPELARAACRCRAGGNRRVDRGQRVVADGGEHERLGRREPGGRGESRNRPGWRRPLTEARYSAAATNPRSNTMSAMMLTAGVGWLTLEPADQQHDIHADRGERARARSRARFRPAPSTGAAAATSPLGGISGLGGSTLGRRCRRRGGRMARHGWSRLGVAHAAQPQVGQARDRRHLAVRLRPAVAAQRAPHPIPAAAGAAVVLVEAVADVQRLPARVPPPAPARPRRSPAAGLARAHLRRGHDPVEQRRQSRALEHARAVKRPSC